MKKTHESLLTPFQRKLLETELSLERHATLRQRIEIMLRADGGETQTQICQALGCSAVTARYWIGMARTGNAHLWKQQSFGRPKQVNQTYLDRLRVLVQHCPKDYGYSFNRWTGNWLSQHLEKELGIKVSDRYVNALLKKMGLSTRKASAPVASAQNTAHRIAIRDIQTSQVPTDSHFLHL